MVAHRHVARRWKQSLALLISITLGVAAVITVLSVTNGFQSDLTERILGLTSHLVILPLVEPYFPEPDQTLEEILKVPGVMGAAPGLFTQGLLTRKGVAKSVQVRGIVPQAEVGISPALGRLSAGNLGDLRPSKVLLGAGVADWLDALVGDEVWITFPSSKTGVFQVVAIFDSGVAQYDNNFAYLCLSEVQELLALSNAVGEIRVALEDPFLAESVADSVRNANPSLETVTWRELNRNLFDALVLEKRVFALVLSLMLVVAGFGIANVLGMHVMQRRRDIAILSTMGLSLRRIRYIFVLQGAFLGIVGSLLGGAIGLLLSWGIGVFGLPLPGDLYPVDQVPVQIRVADVIFTMMGGMAISLVASYFPARRISTSAPAEVLRYG